MAESDQINKAQVGLQILRNIQEQRNNARPNVNHNFSTSSPFFSFSAQRRKPETDALTSTIQSLNEIQKAKKKSEQAAEALAKAQEAGLQTTGVTFDNDGNMQTKMGPAPQDPLAIIKAMTGQGGLMGAAQQQGDAGAVGAGPQMEVKPTVSVDSDGKMRISLTPQETIGSKEARETAKAEKTAERQIKTQAKKDALGRLNKIDNLLPILDQLDESLASVPVEAGIKGKLQGMKQGATGFFGGDPFAETIRSERQGLRPQVAKTLGDVGNLTEQEQKNAIGLAPSETDGADTRAMKSLGTTLFAKKIFKREAKKAGLENDPEMMERISTLNQGIAKRVGAAIESFSSLEPAKRAKFVTRLQDFIGDQIDELDIPKFKDVADAEKNSDSEPGEVIMIGKRLVLVN